MSNGNFTNLNATGNVTARGFVSALGAVIGSSVATTGRITGASASVTGTISAAGNVSGQFIIGNGAFLTGVVSTSAPSNVANTVSGNAQPNVTTVGTLLNLSVFGLTRAANIAAGGNVIAQGNVAGRNLLTSGTVSALGNVTGAFILGNGQFLSGVTATTAAQAATVTSSAQPAITSVGTLNSLSVFGTTTTFNLTAGGAVRAAGNITGNYLFGNGAFLTGITSGGGSSTVAVTVSGNAQPNITSVGTLSTLSVTGTIRAGNIVGNGAGITGIAGSTPARATVSVSTGPVASGASVNVTAVGYRGYALYAIQTSTAAWVTVYSSVGSRTADATRPQTVDPVPGSGVVAEVVTPGASTQLFTPAAVGFSSEATPSTDIQLKVVNNSAGQANVVVTLTLLKMEN
jgi:hypothetical protein